MTCSGNTSISEAIASPGWIIARNFEGAEIKELCWIAAIVCGRGDDILPIKKLSATAIVVDKIVIHAERVAAHQRQYPAGRPAFSQTADCLPLRKLIGGGPHKALANIEIRRPLVAFRVRIVIQHGCVWYIILAVARIINRVRPCVG